MKLSDWADLARIFHFLVTLGLLAVGTWAARVTLRQLRVSATTDLFHRFNDPEARKQRRWVYHNCRQLVDPQRLAMCEREEDALSSLEAACNSLDWAGLLVRKKLLNKTDAIELYGDSLIRTWVILRRWVYHTRSKRSSPSWLWSHFQQLASDAAKDNRFESWITEGVPIYTPTEIITLDFVSSAIIGIDPITQAKQPDEGVEIG